MPFRAAQACAGRLAAALTLAFAPAAAASVAQGPDSGRPVPRFESLRSGDANARRGPALDQPALHRYVRQGLPLEVIGESGPWRRVRDPDGAESWMHRDLLSLRQTVYVKAANGAPTPLYPAPSEQRRPRAMLATGVVAELLECAGPWRKLAVAGREGWARQEALWGARVCVQ